MLKNVLLWYNPTENSVMLRLIRDQMIIEGIQKRATKLIPDHMI